MNRRSKRADGCFLGPPPPCCHYQAHKEAGAEAYEEQVVRQSVPWKEWYGKRLIASWSPSADDSPSFISRCANDLTSFLSRLPATKSADCILLSTYLANLVYPDSPSLQDILVNETMNQLQAKRKAREEREVGESWLEVYCWDEEEEEALEGGAKCVIGGHHSDRPELEIFESKGQL